MGCCYSVGFDVTLVFVQTAIVFSLWESTKVLPKKTSYLFVLTVYRQVTSKKLLQMDYCKLVLKDIILFVRYGSEPYSGQKVKIEHKDSI